MHSVNTANSNINVEDKVFPVPRIQWVTLAFSPGVRRPGREADHSPSTNAEFMNSGATIPLPDTFSWRGG
jgi:hypothetical protein